MSKQPTKRLSNFDFSMEGAHVALVDAAANEHEILVMKSLNTEEQTMPEMEEQKLEEVVKSAEEVIAEETAEKAVEKAEATEEVVEEVEKSEETTEEVVEEVEKAEEKAEEVVEEVEKSAEELSEVEILKAKVAELEAEKAMVTKAREEAEKQDFVAKAKDMQAVVTGDATEFGHAMFAIKSLCPEQFEIVSKALDQANENLSNLDFVAKEVGSSEPGEDLSLEGEELVVAKAKKLMEDNPEMKPYEARTEVRKELRKEGKL